MNIVLEINHKQVTTSELMKQRPTLRTGLLSSIGLTSVRRFERYLQGSDREDFQRDAKVIARDMNNAMKQVDHRIKTEGNIISGGLIESRRGQWMGYSIVIILIAMSALLAILGHDWVAGGMMTAAIALAVVFVLHQNPKSENVAEQGKNN